MSIQSLNEEGSSPITSKRWKSYVTASAAVVAGTAGAHAVIVTGVTPPQDMLDTTPDDGALTSFAFQLLGNIDLVFLTSQSVASSSFLATAPTGLSFAGIGSGGYFYPSNVAYGDVIGPMTFGVPQGARGDMAFGTCYENSEFVDTGGYVAFRFNTPETGGYHGWAELTLIEGAPVNTFRPSRYAYANDSDGLTVGQVAPIPEPSSMASLALGAVGLLSWRRSRRVK